jgi:hypothetical protein
MVNPTQNLARVWFEGQHAERAAGSACNIGRRRDHRAVAPMDAVEIANGHDGATGVLIYMTPMANNSHGRAAVPDLPENLDFAPENKRSRRC